LTKIGDLMTKKLETIEASLSAQEATMKMRDRKVSTLVVIDVDSKPVGLVTERDLVIKVCIHDARKLRNKLQHKDRSIKYTSDQTLAASNIVGNAITGLKFLKTEYEKI
jgi:signal-transduction protein with cAMP-binding, CBS, and nucleotidyltransferase domain